MRFAPFLPRGDALKLIVRLLIGMVVIFGVAYLSDGSLLQIDGWTVAFWAAVVMGVVNAVIRPVVKILALPITILTLGLFSLVLNALLLYLVAWIVPGLEIVGFIQTVVAALIISVVTSVANKIADKD